MVERDLMEQHRAQFNLEAFGVDCNGAVIDSSKTPKSESKAMTQDEWSKIVTSLSKWKRDTDVKMLPIEDQEKYAAFKNDHKEEWKAEAKNFYKWAKIYAVEEGQLASGEAVKRLVRIEPEREKKEPSLPRRLVIPMLEIFDVINDCHSDGHLGMERTCTSLAKKYYSVSQSMVSIFVKKCYHCNQKQPAIKAAKGAKKPIVSHEFRDRFQVDLIDMRKKAMENVYGVMQRWILTLKDHATGMTYISTLPRKKATYVVHELGHIFGYIGYPHIFHTDNGKEFVARVIIDLLKELDPKIATVTGRPRTPRDQGSVESMNKLIKQVLGNLESQLRAKGLTPNWTHLTGRIMSVINNQCGRGRYAETAYKATFGQDFDLPVRSFCSTIEERLRDNVDSRLEAVAKETCYMEGEGPLDTIDEVDEAYWEDDSEDENDFEREEIKKDADNNAINTVSEDVESEPIEMDADLREVLMNIAEEPSEEPKYVGNASVPAATDEQTERKLEFCKECVSEGKKNTDVSSLTIMKERQQYPLDMAWANQRSTTSRRKGGRGKRNSSFEKEYQFVYPTLSCCCCCFSGSNLVPVGDEAYMDDCENTNRWWDNDHISSFTSLVAHEQHIDAHLRSDVPKTQLIHCVTPSATLEESECRELERGIERVVSILHDVDHFATVEISIASNLVTLFDGLKRSLKHWQNHIVNILKRCKLIDRNAVCKYAAKYNDHFREEYELIYQGAEGNDESWAIRNDKKIQQRDTYNCGPIACVKIMELYQCNGYKIIDHNVIDVSCYRQIVINEFKRLLSRFNNDLILSFKTDVLDLTHNDDSVENTRASVDCFCHDHHPEMKVVEVPCCKKILHVECLVTNFEISAQCPFCRALIDRKQLLPNCDMMRKLIVNSDNEETKPEDLQVEMLKPSSSVGNSNNSQPLQMTVAVRQGAMDNKRKHQEQSHERMKRWRKDDIGSSGLSPGSVVTVRVNSNVMSHSRGIIGVVADAKAETGGVLVVCEAGLICKTDQMENYWIPFDEYVIKAKADEEFPLPSSMNAVRKEIVEGTFNVDKQKRVSIQKAHQSLVGASSPCIKKACKCKAGMCKGICGCRRSKPSQRCHSGCSCNGSCDYTETINSDSE